MGTGCRFQLGPDLETPPHRGQGSGRAVPPVIEQEPAGGMVGKARERTWPARGARRWRGTCSREELGRPPASYQPKDKTDRASKRGDQRPAPPAAPGCCNWRRRHARSALQRPVSSSPGRAQTGAQWPRRYASGSKAAARQAVLVAGRGAGPGEPRRAMADRRQSSSVRTAGHVETDRWGSSDTPSPLRFPDSQAMRYEIGDHLRSSRSTGTLALAESREQVELTQARGADLDQRCSRVCLAAKRPSRTFSQKENALN